jgi:thiol-disulfide isomerase/thioredoxin
MVVLAAGAAAAAAGIGVSMLRGADRLEPSPDIWALRLPRPGGGEIAFADLRGKPLLINFWATWCPPCVEEMPLLARFARQHKQAGWQVVGIAVDREQAVRDFIAAKGIDFPIGLASGEGLALSRSLGNSAGGLPFSIALDASGRASARKLGALSEGLLDEWVKQQRGTAR